MFDSPTADFSHRDLDLDSLPSKELAILVKGMAKLRRSIMWDQSLYISPNPDFSACAFRGVAPSCQDMIASSWSKSKVFICSAGDTLLRLESFKEMLSEMLGGPIGVEPGQNRSLACSRCRAQAIAEIQARRRMIWTTLPAVFGVVRLAGMS